MAQALRRFGLGLETAGIERDDRGFIKVDDRLRTTAAGVWAVGNCARRPISHISPTTE